MKNGENEKSRYIYNLKINIELNFYDFEIKINRIIGDFIKKILLQAFMTLAVKFSECGTPTNPTFGVL